MDRISSMMEETTAEVENTSEPSVVAKSGARAIGQDRVKSLMDMEYEEEEKEQPKEPEVEQKKEHPIPDPSKKSDDDSEDDEESEDKEPKQKEKKEEKKDEEEKKESEKKKVKYKLDGEEIEEELSDEEIASAVSGRKAIQKRFTEIDQQRKAVQKEKEEVQKTFEYVKNEMAEIKSGFESVISEFAQNGINKSNPIETVYKLLDKMGLDTAQFEKAVFFHHIPEVARFLDMDDTGREAHLLAQENKWLKKRQDAVENERREAQQLRAKLEQENSAKRQAGVSEEEFEELKGELETRFGMKDLKLEQVLEWKVAKPAYSRAEAINEKVGGKVNVHKIARLLLEFPETTDEWVLENLGYKEKVKEDISRKLQDKGGAKPPVKKLEKDLDEELFKQFRRR